MAGKRIKITDISKPSKKLSPLAKEDFKTLPAPFDDPIRDVVLFDRCLDARAQRLGDLANDGQANAAMRAGVGAGRVGAPEAIEDPPHLIRAQATARIGDAQNDRVVRLFGRDPDAPMLVRVFERVVQDIGDDHPDMVFAGHADEVVADLIIERQLAIVSLIGKQPPALIDQRLEIYGLPCQ